MFTSFRKPTVIFKYQNDFKQQIKLETNDFGLGLSHQLNWLEDK